MITKGNKEIMVTMSHTSTLFCSTIQYFSCSTSIYFCRGGSHLFTFYSHLCRSVSHVFLYLNLIFYSHLCSDFNSPLIRNNRETNPKLRQRNNGTMNNKPLSPKGKTIVTLLEQWVHCYGEQRER